jgi:D-sedoheptulose 7-phosphate isomerase
MAGVNSEGSTDKNAALIRRRLRDSIDVKQRLLDSSCVELAAQVAERIVAALSSGRKVIFFGNGGSSMDAGHLAAELLGRFYYDRPPLAATSLADSTAAMTAIGNDYEFAEVFARQVRGIGGPGDVLVGLTTSGNSENVVRALAEGQALRMVTVAMTGSRGGRVADVAELCIKVPTDDTPRVQEACLHLGHSICELVEQAMFSSAEDATKAGQQLDRLG